MIGSGENPEMAFACRGEGWADNRFPMFHSVSGNGSVAGEILVFIRVSLGETRCALSRIW